MRHSKSRVLFPLPKPLTVREKVASSLVDMEQRQALRVAERRRKAAKYLLCANFINSATMPMMQACIPFPEHHDGRRTDGE